MDVVAEASNGREGVKSFGVAPRCVIMTLSCLKWNGIEATLAILKEIKAKFSFHFDFLFGYEKFIQF